MEHVGELVRQHRGELGMSQEELAKRAGISPAALVRLEGKQIARPRISTLTKLAGALGVQPGELTRFVSEVQRPSAHDEMPGPFTAVYERDGEWWIGYVEELPGANAQGASLDEARESLKEAVSLVLESNRELTRREFAANGGDVVREPIGA